MMCNFSFDTLNRKVTVHLQNDPEVDFSDIGQMLGFSSNTRISSTSIATREADLEQGFHDLYVYCDIIQAQFVGDALVPLLRIGLHRTGLHFISPRTERENFLTLMECLQAIIQKHLLVF